MQCLASMSKTKRQIIALVAVVGSGGAFLWYFEYGPRTREVATVEAAEVTGRGFAISVPQGFEVVKDARMKSVTDAGGVALASTGRTGSASAASRGFKASIVVIPVPTAWDGDPASEAACAQIAQGSAASVAATVVRQQIVQASWGSTCQYELVEKDRPARGAVGTVVYKGTSMWVVTCNLNPQDGRARAACDEVLRSWKFSASG